MPIFNRGDIVLVPLDPAVGQEQSGARPALVLSPKAFNRLGDVLVAPITQGGNWARSAGFAVSLSASGSKTQGVVLVNKIRLMDLTARGAKRLETASSEVIDEALAKLSAILDPSHV